MVRISKVVKTTRGLAKFTANGNQNLFHPITTSIIESSSSNNYSTYNFKKESSITSAQLRTNNKMVNVFAVSNNFRNYSTSNSESNDKTSSKPEEPLNPVKYASWRKEQVCSLLCTDVEKGGAGLNVEGVKPLYDAGFNGLSLSIIVRNIQYKEELKKLIINSPNYMGNIQAIIDLDKYPKNQATEIYPSASKETIEGVVNWVENLLKTRLYHLWSKEQLFQQLKKPVEEGGACLENTDASDLLFKQVKTGLEISLPDPIKLWIQNGFIHLRCVDFEMIKLKTLGIDKLDAFSIKIEKFGESWIYSGPNFPSVAGPSGVSGIFSNVNQMKGMCESFYYAATEIQRGRPSIEVLGQVRTGKTSTACYIIPQQLANVINDLRTIGKQPKLTMAPTFYIRFFEKDSSINNPIELIYNKLQPLRDAVAVKRENNSIIDTCRDFTNEYANTHIFIVLDEVQFLEPKHLDILRETVKHKEYAFVTFILVGSTQGRFLRVLDKAIKNGLSYQEATVAYNVPIDNESFEDTFKFHNQEPFTDDQMDYIKQVFGCLNCATVSQIIQIMRLKNVQFENAINKLVHEIFGIFDRDILPYFSKEEGLATHMQSLIIDGSFATVVFDDFYDNYIKYFVDVKETTNDGKLITYYSFKDLLLRQYLLMRLTPNKNGRYILSTLSFTDYGHYIILTPIATFGERINKCKKQPYNTSYAEIKKFWHTSKSIKHLTQQDIDNMYQFLYNLQNKQLKQLKQHPQPKQRQHLPTTTANELKLEEIFILIRHMHNHSPQTNDTISKEIYNEVLNHWFNWDKKRFYEFIHEVSKECLSDLS